MTGPWSRVILAGGLGLLLLWLILLPGDAPPPPTAPPAGSHDASGSPTPFRPDDESVVPANGSAPAEAATPAPAAYEMHTVAGIVYRQDGESPLKGGVVTGQQEGLQLHSRIGSDGRFRVAGLRPGNVDLVVKRPPRDAGGRTRLTVTAGDQKVCLVLAPRGRLRFVILDSVIGGPVTARPSVIEVLEDHERTRATATGGSDPDDGGVVLLPGQPFRFRVVADGYAPSKVLTREFSRDDPVQTVEVRLRPDPDSLATLVLTLRLPDGTHPPTAIVTRHFDFGDSTGTDSLSHRIPEGQVAVRVPPGVHEFEIQATGARGGPWVPVRFRIELARGERAERELRFERGGYIRIGWPTADPPQYVWFHRSKDRVHLRGIEGESGEQAWSRFGPLAEGVWRLSLRENDEKSSHAVKVVAGETTDFLMPRDHSGR